MVELPTRKIRVKDLSAMASTFHQAAKEVFVGLPVSDEDCVKVAEALGPKKAIDLFKKFRTWPVHPSDAYRNAKGELTDRLAKKPRGPILQRPGKAHSPIRNSPHRRTIWMDTETTTGTPWK